jgi:hypothetical protein
VCVISFNVIRAVETSVRHSAIRSNLSSLAVYIEGYKEEMGNYPNSLHELVSKSKVEYKSQINRILNDQWADCYEYQAGTDGFAITVTIPKSCFVKKETFERNFKVGKVLESPDLK